MRDFITDAMFNFDGGVRQIIGPQGTGGIFATYPQTFVSLEVGLIDQVRHERLRQNQ